METMSHFIRRSAVVLGLMCVALIAGCGGGGDVSGSVVVVVPPPVPITALGIVLTRTGPQTVQVDWTDDPYVASFTVSRDGYLLASGVTTTTLIDQSVVLDQSYCYLVDGYDSQGYLIAQSDPACITIVP
jgi:hypothetical protein